MGDPDKLIHSLVSFLALDGVVGPEERRFLNETRERLGVPASVLDQAFVMIEGGKGKLHLPGDPRELREFFYLLVQSAAADGRIDPKERQILGQVAERAGISEMDLNNAIEVRLELAAEASRKLLAAGPGRRTSCPKCGFEQPAGGLECLRCGVVFAKLRPKRAAERPPAEQAPIESAPVGQTTAEPAGGLEALESLTGLAVVQRRDWLEALTPLEVTNAYAVSDPDGQPLFQATESEGEGFFTRFFLQQWRPFEIDVREAGSRLSLIRVSRPFRFIFHEAAVYGRGPRPLLGRIHKQFAWLRRIYRVEDGEGRLLFELFGPILHPWTFEVRRGGRTIGKITKQWSGLVTEAFTKADNFGVVFPASLPVSEKAILLGAVFLIDFVHFESKNNG